MMEHISRRLCAAISNILKIPSKHNFYEEIFPTPTMLEGQLQHETGRAEVKWNQVKFRVEKN